MTLIRNILLVTIIAILLLFIGSKLNTKIIEIHSSIQEHSEAITNIEKSVDNINKKIYVDLLSDTKTIKKNGSNLSGAISGDYFHSKIAVVDVESVLEHSLAIAQIKDFMNNISKQIHNDLTIKEKSLKQDEAELIAQRGVLATEQFEEAVSEFNKKISSIQQEKQKKKAELDQAHVAAITEVHENTVAVIKELSQKYGFNLVFPSSQILFVENNLNITLEVISKLNERLKTVKIQYNPDT